VINSHKTNLDNAALLDHVDVNYHEQVTQAVGSIFNKMFKHVFGNVKLPSKLINELKTIAYGLITKDIFPSNTSGVVFAGFGEKEIFPSVISVQTEGVFFNRLKRQAGETHSITFESIAAIVPFAQSEMGIRIYGRNKSRLSTISYELR
jgi:hypothetical protein